MQHSVLKGGRVIFDSDAEKRGLGALKCFESILLHQMEKIAEGLTPFCLKCSGYSTLQREGSRIEMTLHLTRCEDCEKAAVEAAKEKLGL